MAEEGVRIEVVGFHGKTPMKQGNSEHLWIMLSMFKVNPEARGKVFLDRENLISIAGPGCFWCERPWTPELAAQPCTGDPVR